MYFCAGKEIMSASPHSLVGYRSLSQRTILGSPLLTPAAPQNYVVTNTNVLSDLNSVLGSALNI